LADATVATLLSAATQRIDRLDAEILLANLLGTTRAWLFSHGEDPVPADRAERLRARVERRAAGEPTALILGVQDFWTLTLKVTGDTLIPRPDTELLVELALQAPQSGPLTVLDAGTGSGAIAAALSSERPDWRVLASDCSIAALRVAACNCGERVPLFCGSWLQCVAPRSVDMIVSNPPYIAEGDPHLDALQFEPITALTSGADGLAAIGELVEGSRETLRPGGWLLLEHGFDQGRQVKALCESAGYTDVTVHTDLAGHERATMAQWP
tara:strand:+ start:77 stop:883 length:807 start_codon:yes stop_codon:yes gene_type:complete